MGKKAVLIGCNYPDSDGAELSGCVNDVWRTYDCLVDFYGFRKHNIKVLIDTDDDFRQPTGRNIRRAITKLVRSAEFGDDLFVHFSGHGSRIPSCDPNDNTGYDEFIIPADMNPIYDDEFRELVDQVPKGCRITIIADCCYSGGLTGNSKEQIGESTKQYRPESSRNRHGGSRRDYVKNRSLRISTLINILKQKTGKEDISTSNLRLALFEIFGEDVTPKIKKLVEAAGLVGQVCNVAGNLAQDLGHRQFGKVLNKFGDIAQDWSSLAQDFVGLSLAESSDQAASRRATYRETHRSIATNRRPQRRDRGILISACQSHQTSADVCPSGNPDEAYGALSDTIQCIIDDTSGCVTNRELVLKARKMLKSQGFSQRPGLYCSDRDADAQFIFCFD